MTDVEMSISEIRKEKEKLENEIKKLLLSFQSKTNMRVNEIKVSNLLTAMTDSFVNVGVKINIEDI